jgi:hypothetical protein
VVVVGSWRDGNILFCSSVFIMVLFILWLKRFEAFLQSNMQEPLLNIENAYCQQLQTLTNFLCRLASIMASLMFET